MKKTIEEYVNEYRILTNMYHYGTLYLHSEEYKINVTEQEIPVPQLEQEFEELFRNHIFQLKQDCLKNTGIQLEKFLNSNKNQISQKSIATDIYSCLYKAKVKNICDVKYALSKDWIIGELHTKIIKGRQKPFIHFYVTVTNQYISFEHLNSYILNGREIYEKTVEVDVTTLCRCTGKKDISGEWIFQNDIIESHSGTVVLYPDMVVKYGTYQAYCPHDQCDVPSVGFYATGENLPDMPIGEVEEYAKVVGNIHN